MIFKNANWIKIISEIIVGMVAGILGGIFGLFVFMIYGGNYGCFAMIDALFGTQGFESCGLFGSILGMFIGSLGSILLLHHTSFQKNSYEKIAATSLILLIIIPLIVSVMLGFSFKDIFPGFIKVAGFSVIPSLLITILLNYKLFLKIKN